MYPTLPTAVQRTSFWNKGKITLRFLVSQIFYCSGRRVLNVKHFLHDDRRNYPEIYCGHGHFHLLSRKLGLDAGSSALSLPEMLFRTWGRKMNREASEPRGRVRGRLVQNESTFQSDLSRLKTLTPARARRSGGRKTSIFWVLVLKQGGREIGIS